jgi:hypothetical protein
MARPLFPEQAKIIFLYIIKLSVVKKYFAVASFASNPQTGVFVSPIEKVAQLLRIQSSG